MAEVTLGKARMRVFGMHLDLSGLWRRKQAAAVIHAAGLREEMPTVLMGDLNEWSAGRGCLADFARHYSFAPCGRSFHARRPVAQLDRIMHCGQLKLVDSGVHDSAAAVRIGDELIPPGICPPLFTLGSSLSRTKPRLLYSCFSTSLEANGRKGGSILNLVDTIFEKARS
jgi:hypothetical protein